VHPSSAADQARVELAAEILDDLRRVDAQLRELHQRLTAVVLASKTSVTSIVGVGSIVAAMVVGITGDVSRFRTSDHFAAYAGTAPIEVSSGPHKIFRLSRRGNRQLNHAIHMAAVTQIRNRNSDGYAYYQRKIAEGKSPKMALRALKRRITTTLFDTMIRDARHQPPRHGPVGPTGT